ncbi:MAG: pyridoxal-phosphate dependent enzyme, partial [Rhodospirillaceae bacterium]
MSDLPTKSEIEAAAETVYAAMAPTPQYTWPLLAQATGANVWVKHENHTPTGAFKVRGGLVYMRNLREQRPDVRGVIAATRGNHGQSIAFGARANGIDAVIVVPEGNS